MKHFAILILLLLIAAAAAPEAAAQVVAVDGHYGLADATTHRLLVSVDATDATALPATFSIDGAEYEVQATTLPLVRLDHEEVNRDAFSPGALTLIAPGSAPQRYDVELRYRGATAHAYDKKNYAVKLLDAVRQPLDASLLGMRTDNSWILDAMASDVARMRNRASTDFWLDFSQRPYYADLEPDMVNGTHGRFVEAFVADRYWGIYCLTEKVDRKQLRLKKHKDGSPRGLLYKSFQWDNLHELTEPCPDPEAYTWQGWECSYPDNRKGEPFDWRPLYDAIGFFCIPVPDFDLNDYLWKHADLPLWRDYNLFCDLLHADDNTCKNMYVYFRDATSPASLLVDTVAKTGLAPGTIVSVDAPGPLCICPWDLDATWGRTFDRQPIDPTANCNVSNAINYHLYISQYDKGKAYDNRWAQLRQTYFTTDAIWPYFERYFSLFATSGAADREVERWQDVNGVHLDFDAEAAFIHDWIGRRLSYLDGDYNYVPATGIVPLVASDPLPPAALLPVFTADGRLAARCASPADVTTMGLPAGVYLVAGRKVIVR